MKTTTEKFSVKDYLKVHNLHESMQVFQFLFIDEGVIEFQLYIDGNAVKEFLVTKSIVIKLIFVSSYLKWPKIQVKSGNQSSHVKLDEEKSHFKEYFVLKKMLKNLLTSPYNSSRFFLCSLARDRG